MAFINPLSAECMLQYKKKAAAYIKLLKKVCACSHTIDIPTPTWIPWVSSKSPFMWDWNIFLLWRGSLLETEPFLSLSCVLASLKLNSEIAEAENWWMSVRVVIGFLLLAYEIIWGKLKGIPRSGKPRDRDYGCLGEIYIWDFHMGWEGDWDKLRI